MNETRAVANLPHLDIEIRHKSVPEERAEYLSINLRAAPDFEVAARVLEPLFLLAAWTAFNPWVAWAQMTVQGLCAPSMRRPPHPHSRGAPALRVIDCRVEPDQRQADPAA
jgi:hypothetical protein